MHATRFKACRLALHKEMAKAYHAFLTYVYVDNKGDDALHKGTAEFRNKFLSCYHIENASLAPIFLDKSPIVKQYDKPGIRRYLIADYYSKAALLVLRNCQPLRKQLRFEHVVPKAEAVQVECERRIKDGTLQVTDIQDLLDKYWHTAVVIHDEEKMLRPRHKMPADWKIEDGVLARYGELSKVKGFGLYRAVEDFDSCEAVLT